MEDAVHGKHFVDGLAPRLVPHFFEPSRCKFLLSLLLIEHGVDSFSGDYSPINMLIAITGWGRRLRLTGRQVAGGILRRGWLSFMEI